MPETILVVDDDPDVARFVEVNLRSAGLRRRRRRRRRGGAGEGGASCGPTWCCST